MGDGGEHSAMQVETRTKVGRGVERLRPRTPFRSMLAGMLTSFNMALTQAWWGKHVGSTLASGCMMWVARASRDVKVPLQLPNLFPSSWRFLLTNLCRRPVCAISSILNLLANI